MADIEDIASTHLGKSASGQTVSPYETPKSVDSSWLVGVPRALNRVRYDIDDPLPFDGV